MSGPVSIYFFTKKCLETVRRHQLNLNYFLSCSFQNVAGLTYILGSGHYSSLASTHRRPGFTASLKSPFMTTTGRCLELFYLFTGPGISTITVKVFRQDLVAVPVFQVHFWHLIIYYVMI